MEEENITGVTAEEMVMSEDLSNSSPENENELETVEDDNTEALGSEPVEPESNPLEEKYNNILEALRQEREERRRERELYEQRYQPQKSPEQLAAEQEEEEALRALEPLVDKLAQRKGWVKQEDILKEREEEQSRQQITKQVEELEKRYDGKNGMPRFSRQQQVEIMKYGAERGIFNLEAAFEHKYRSQIFSAYTSNASRPVNVPKPTANPSNSAPDFSQMSSQQIMEWQRSQGLAV